jgi:hypothetical protein
MKTAFTIVSIFALAAAKLDYGPCPSNIQQVPWKASMTGTYYVQYYDKFFDYAMPIFKYTEGIETFDCLNGQVKIPERTYDRDTQPLKKRLSQPYIIFQDTTESALIGYMCFDARFLNDLVGIGLKLPDWAVAYWNKFTEIFQTFHLKVLAVASKTSTFDATLKDEVATFINTLPYKRSFPYQFPKDFSLANQDSQKCGYPIV